MQHKNVIKKEYTAMKTNEPATVGNDKNPPIQTNQDNSPYWPKAQVIPFVIQTKRKAQPCKSAYDVFFEFSKALRRRFIHHGSHVK
jgi:hypothetical protein